MGRPIELKDITAASYREFSARLDCQLEQLREHIKSPSFNKRCLSLGAELEVYLVDDNKYQPASANQELLALVNHPCLTLELNRYNLEMNLTPVEVKGVSPFALIEKEMRFLLDRLEECARTKGVHVIPIGILPTLKPHHLTEEYMTDRARYHALKESLCENHTHSNICITGRDQLVLQGEGISVEGANTSFQVHLRVPAHQFANYFNAAQLTTPLLLALSANSPLVLGHRLWQESRVALFKQSVDFRERSMDWRRPSRVTFCHGWVRKEAWELFAASVALYKPLLPILYNENESLPELRLHHGTIWPWNRAVYAPGENGHLRIEFRTLPAGTTVVDMLANAALAVGFTLGLMEFMDDYSARLPFHFAEYNFYRGAQHGLEACLLWPHRKRGGFGERPIVDIIEELLPLAYEGLKKLESQSSDIDRLWRVVEERFEKRITGAQWQLNRFEHYRKKCDVDESCYRTLVDYKTHVMSGEPVALW